jgi:uncharacterized membrane-anchored protein
MMYPHIFASLMTILAASATIETVLEGIATILTDFVGGAATVMFIISGYLWMTSGEFPAREEWAKRAIGAAAGGTILVLIANILATALKSIPH